MKALGRIIAAWLGAGAIALGAAAEERQPQSLQQLLEFVQQGQAVDAREAREREARFVADKAGRQAELERARALRAEQQKRSAALEKRFEANERELAKTQARLRERLGSLGDLLGNVTAAAGDARATFQASLTGAELGGARVAKADELVSLAGSGVDLPTIEHLEALWYELQQEMVASGTVTAFAAPVIRPDGNRTETPVVRVGVFNIVSAEGRYLDYQGDKGLLTELPRQPGGGFVDAAAGLAAATGGVHPFGIDPTGPSGGSYLAALIETPTFGERIRQGGLVGYITMALGLFGLVLAAYRLVVLARMDARVAAQLASPRANPDNPLGRVLAVHQNNPHMDIETLELKLSEAVIRELPRIESGLTLLKIIATVAPLLGLLGTVTGMIVTFQAITIFGAGDPKAMANGISQALVTTVQGLCVAIPIVLAHTLVGNRARKITQILEEETTGVIAEHSGYAQGND